MTGRDLGLTQSQIAESIGSGLDKTDFLRALMGKGFPNQFLCLAGDQSLFQSAAKRQAALGRRRFPFEIIEVQAGRYFGRK
jgi:hypothetical protein